MKLFNRWLVRSDEDVRCGPYIVAFDVVELIAFSKIFGYSALPTARWACHDQDVVVVRDGHCRCRWWHWRGGVGR